jgi:glycosyltransferase involved in cell wall biosynthesis
VKVLLVPHFFPPGFPGGTESYTFGLARELKRRGHAPYVMCATKWGQGSSIHPVASDDEFEGIPVRRLAWNWQAAPDPFRYLYNNPEVNREFGAYLAALRPDVVHITSCYAFGAGIIQVAHDAGIPVFMTFTDFWFLCPRHTLWRGDGSLCEGPTSAATCASCMSAGTPLGNAFDNVLPRSLSGPILSGVSRIPVIARQRGFRGYVGDTSGRLAFVRRMFDLIDCPLGPSRFMIETLGRNGYDADRIQYSPYGHDLGWVNQVKPRTADGRLVFGYLGQIDPLKGVDVLVDAFKRIPLDQPVELRLFGNFAKNPDYVAALRRSAEGDPRIHFVGPFGRDQIADVFSELDLVVVPSMWYENTPIVISEAFAAGKPVIATNLGGMSEAVVHNVNGLLFDRGDAAELAQWMVSLANDRSLYERLIRGVRSPRTIDTEISELLDSYRNSIAYTDLLTHAQRLGRVG